MEKQAHQMLWMFVYAAKIARGEQGNEAAKAADAAVEKYKSRWTESE